MTLEELFKLICELVTQQEGTTRTNVQDIVINDGRSRVIEVITDDRDNVIKLGSTLEDIKEMVDGAIEDINSQSEE